MLGVAKDGLGGKAVASSRTEAEPANSHGADTQVLKGKKGKGTKEKGKCRAKQSHCALLSIETIHQPFV